jgi:hypothetical protein
MAPLSLEAAEPRMAAPPAVTRLGHPAALGHVALLSDARDRVAALPLDSAWRPSDPELDRLVAVPTRLGAARVELRRGATPEVGLIASGNWLAATVYRALTGVVADAARDAWDDAGMRLPPGAVARVDATVDLRQDTLSVTVFTAVPTTPQQRQAAQIHALASHLGADARDVAWLCGAHELLAGHQPFDALVGVTLVGEGLRPWLTLRYPGAPPAAARDFRDGLGPLVATDDPLGRWLADAPPATCTLELRAGGGPPRVSVEIPG